MAFLLAELGTSGSLDGQQRLVVKGRFAPKNFEGILRRYISEYRVYFLFYKKLILLLVETGNCCSCCLTKLVMYMDCNESEKII
jgi:hypothetical protein